MTVAEYIANQLFNKGVRHVFGIPGGPSIPYIEALRKAGIEFFLTSNEASAAFMADVTARLTGVPGVCHSTFGPGATNISTGVGGALLDRSPVLVLTSEMSDKMINRTSQMNIDHQKLFAPITKATFRLNISNAADTIDKALRIAVEQYPGPVHIGLPADIALSEIGEPGISISGESRIYFNGNTDKIIQLLQKAQRPLLAIGLTAARLKLGDRLISFLEKCNVPVVVTPMATGIIPTNHRSFAGVLFHSLSDYLDDITCKADLVIGMGYDQVEFNYESWLPDVPLIHFDIKETDLPERDNIYRYISAPGEWFSLLDNAKRIASDGDDKLISGLREEMLAVFNGFTGHFGPAAALRTLREELPESTIVTADVGSHLHLMGQFWNTGKTGRLIMTNGWSSMGFGIPAAMAAQLTNPDAVVACVTGDGGFLMMAGELITMRRYNLPVIIIVMSDGELNLIKTKQSWVDAQPYGTILYSGDLFESDTFFGVRVIKADSIDSFRKGIVAALAINEPVIINAVIDPEDYNWLIVKR